jgi:hypothetical protein
VAALGTERQCAVLQYSLGQLFKLHTPGLTVLHPIADCAIVGTSIKALSRLRLRALHSNARVHLGGLPWPRQGVPIPTLPLPLFDSG